MEGVRLKPKSILLGDGVAEATPLPLSPKTNPMQLSKWTGAIRPYVRRELYGHKHVQLRKSKE